MLDQKFQDQILSHRILNYLNAAYQGEASALRVLSELEHPASNESLRRENEESLVLISAWLDKLWDGETLFQQARGMRQSEEAVKAFALLECIQKRISTFAAAVKNAREVGDLPNQHQNTAWLISAFTRRVHGEKHYAEGFMQFGTVFNNSDLVSFWKLRLEELAHQLKLADDFLDNFKNPAEMPKNFYDHLEFFCRTLPGIFRCHVHDIALLLHTFKGKFTYERAGFLKPEAAAWDRAEIPPIEAGYWKALDFTKEEVLQWRKAGITDPITAADWRASGFNPEQSATWLQVRFSPLLAIQWAAAGYTPEAAALLVAKKYYYPTQITRQQAEEILAGSISKKQW